MKYVISSLLCITLLPAIASAEIYESKDAQGNSVFTDVPTQNAEEVKLQQSNIADAPPQTSEETSPSPDAAQIAEKAEPTILTIPNSHNEDVEDAALDGDRRTVSDAEERREVMETEVRREVLEAEPRHDVREAQPRRVVN